MPKEVKLKYLVHSELSYEKKTASPGDVVADIPTKSVSWLEEQGHISPADPKPVKNLKSEPQSPLEGDE
jgi:hypothetical protein